MAHKDNIFKAAFYFFIPLEKLTKEYKESFNAECQRMHKDSLIRKSDGDIDYCNLEKHNRPFIYKSGDYNRPVELKVFLIKHTCSLNHKGRYYLVVGAGIDMEFPEEQGRCTKDDLVSLKKAFYEHGDDGLYYSIDFNTIYLHDWLDDVLENVTGKKYNGKYGRHYVINIQAVEGSNITLFNQKYYHDEKEKEHYYDVIEEADRLAYGLVYGNNNYKAVPTKTIQETFKDAFSNNRAEKMFAGNKTIVFLKTHHENSIDNKNTNNYAPLSIGIEGMHNIIEICMVMEAKHRLKFIQKRMRNNSPTKIKESLADISQYLSKNPFRLSEIGKRMDYLYVTLGVQNLFDVVMKQGELISGSVNIKNTMELNIKMYALAGITSSFGLLDFITNILCCDNSNNSSNMCDCFSHGIELQGGCCAVVGCLLFIVLAASIIVMAVYQVKSFYKLDDIERELREMN